MSSSAVVQKPAKAQQQVAKQSSEPAMQREEKEASASGSASVSAASSVVYSLPRDMLYISPDLYCAGRPCRPERSSSPSFRKSKPDPDRLLSSRVYSKLPADLIHSQAGLNLNIFGALSGAFSGKSSKEQAKDGSEVERREETSHIKGVGMGNARAAAAANAEAKSRDEREKIMSR